MRFILKCIFLISLSLPIQAFSFAHLPIYIALPLIVAILLPAHEALIEMEIASSHPYHHYYGHHLYANDYSGEMLTDSENADREVVIKAIQEGECHIRRKAYSCFKNNLNLGEKGFSKCNEQYLEDQESLVDTLADKGYTEWAIHFFSPFPKTEEEEEQKEKWRSIAVDFNECRDATKEEDVASQCLIKALDRFMDVMNCSTEVPL